MNERKIGILQRSYAFKDQEPLYKVVPSTGLQNKQAYGIFFDNTFRTFLILCEEMLAFGQKEESELLFIMTPDGGCCH
jgi:hypothetical protein